MTAKKSIKTKRSGQGDRLFIASVCSKN